MTGTQFLEFVAGRRSTRVFQDREVPRRLGRLDRASSELAALLEGL